MKPRVEITHQDGISEALGWFGAVQSIQRGRFAFYSSCALARSLARDTHLFEEVGEEAPGKGAAVAVPPTAIVDSWREQEALIKLYSVRVQFPGMPHEEMKIPPMVWPLARVCYHVIAEAMDLPARWKATEVAPAMPLYGKRVWRAIPREWHGVQVINALEADSLLWENGLIDERESLECLVRGFYKGAPAQVFFSGSAIPTERGFFLDTKWEKLIPVEALTRAFGNDPDHDPAVLMVKTLLALLQHAPLDIVISEVNHWLGQACWAAEKQGRPVASILSQSPDKPLLNELAIFARQVQILTWEPSSEKASVLESLEQMATFLSLTKEFPQPGDLHRSLATNKQILPTLSNREEAA